MYIFNISYYMYIYVFIMVLKNQRTTSNIFLISSFSTTTKNVSKKNPLPHSDRPELDAWKDAGAEPHASHCGASWVRVLTLHRFFIIDLQHDCPLPLPW